MVATALLEVVNVIFDTKRAKGYIYSVNFSFLKFLKIQH